ncbi:MAG: Calx-beta domain-containing protein, partial [Pyrinomonadaceae bacterium]
MVDGFQSDTGNFVLNWSGPAPTPTPSPTPTPATSVFQFSHPSYRVIENDGSVGVVIVRTGDVSTQQTIHFSAQPFPSILPGPGTNQDITFAAGETFKITAGIGINNDVEPDSDQIATLTLTPVSPGTIIGAQGIATLTIFDDDSFPANSVQFLTRSVGVSEGAGKFEVTYTRAALPGGNLSEDAFVSYRTAGSSAIAGKDFSLANGTLHFLPGETTKTITVLITEDAFDESEETLIIELSKPLGTTLSPLESTVIIS